MNVIAVLQENVLALPDIQALILRKVLAGLYGGLNQHLGLKGADDEMKQQLDRALGARLREIPELFVSANKTEGQVGTLDGTVQSLLGLINAMQLLLQPGGLIASGGPVASISPAEERASRALDAELAEADAQLNKLNQKMEKQQKESIAEEAKLQGIRDQIAALTDKQKQVSAEISSLQTDKSKMDEKVAQSKVFEQALHQMRTSMETETEGRILAQADWADLQTLLKSSKFSWVSPDSMSHCLACRQKFQESGDRTKTWCRYCGRSYCRACVSPQEIPDMGYPAAVSCCARCISFIAALPPKKS